MLVWYDVITQQNYFTNNHDIILQKDGLAMGSPSSGTISEIFLQYLEHSRLTPIADELQLINYYRYVDDVLIMFDEGHTDINTITNRFNSLHPNMQFTNEIEQNNQINYLDITITRKDDHIGISIYGKPTHTNTIIPHTSNHPTPHKYAAIRYLYNRLNTYQLSNEHYQQEVNTIQNILYNNSFPLQKHIHNHQPKHNNNTTSIEPHPQTTQQNTTTLLYPLRDHRTPPKNGVALHTLARRPS
jgi:hypothetical protein